MQGRPVDQQLQRCAHRTEVSAQIDQVGRQQQQHDAARQPRRIMPAQIAGDAKAGDAADAGADLLDRDHQRVAEHQRRGQAVAELRADLRIGGDPAGIVIRRPGDQARPEHPEQLQAIGRLGLIGLRRFRQGCVHLRYSQPAPPSARQCAIDELDGVSAVATAQRVARIADLGDKLAVTRRIGLALWHRAIERPRLRHLQRLLRLPGAPGDERGTGGLQVIVRRRSCRRRKVPAGSAR